MSGIVDNFIAPLCDEELVILYQDDDILLIVKPSGLLSLSGKNPLNKDSVHFRLVQEYPTALMLHRLDFGTSGLLIVGLNKKAATNVNQQFQARTVQKTYIAQLMGHVEQDQGSVECGIAKDPENFPKMKVCAVTGKHSLSHYDVIERVENPTITKVMFRPVTGRTHQLRIHAREMGHPILGCDIYGTDIYGTESYGTESNGNESYGTERENKLSAFNMASRLMLHATSIAFNHPLTNERILAESKCPF